MNEDFDIDKHWVTRSQWLVNKINPNIAYCPWMRSGGKTMYAIGPRIVHISKMMPRTQLLFMSDTFERIHDKLVPNIEVFWREKSGLIEGWDYVAWKKPPDYFTKPFVPIRKFDHVVSFRNGLALCCGSAAVEGSFNGYSGQSAIVDEAKFIKEEVINGELLPALRGLQGMFGHLPEYRSHYYFTDKLGENIEWILAKKSKCDFKLISAVLTMQLQVDEWKQQMQAYSSSATIYQFKNKIVQYETKLNSIRKNLIYYCDAKPYENLKAIGEKFFRDNKRDLPEFVFNVAILNIDPDKVQNAYYPALGKHHCHNIKNDTITHKPLIVALDYQWRIIPLVVGQMSTLPGRTVDTLNIVNGIHTIHPTGGIKKTVVAFCEYYKAHQEKVVYYAYDHTAIARKPEGDSHKDIVCKTLRSLGWIVIEVYIGRAMLHDTRHEDIKNIMLKDLITFNEERAKHPLYSMKMAGAITVSGKTKKDKSKEKRLTNDPVKQTDYSEAADMMIIAALIQKKIKGSNSGSGGGDISLR